MLGLLGAVVAGVSFIAVVCPFVSPLAIGLGFASSLTSSAKPTLSSV